MKATHDGPRFWTRFVLAALAGWRVSHLVSREDGPGNALSNLRARLGSGALGDLMDCFMCTRVWVAAPLTLFVTQRAGELVPTWLALSGAACGLERLLTEARAPGEDESERGGHADGVLRSETVGAPRPFAVAERDGTIR